MISTTHSCRACGSTNIIKCGWNRNGNTRYKCKDCKVIRVLILKPKYTEEKKEEIIKAYMERSSMEGITRIFGTSDNTLRKWLKKNQKD